MAEVPWLDVNDEGVVKVTREGERYWIVGWSSYDDLDTWIKRLQVVMDRMKEIE